MTTESADRATDLDVLSSDEASEASGPHLSLVKTPGPKAPKARRARSAPLPAPLATVVAAPARTFAKAPALPATPPGVVAQVRAALKPANRLAAALGFLLGGFVPLATFFVAHYELSASSPWWAQKGTWLVAGGLAYSAKTVWAWGRLAFGSPVKAAGFVVLLEGVMVTGGIAWLTIAALGYLICINGLATGCTLATKEK